MMVNKKGKRSNRNHDNANKTAIPPNSSKTNKSIEEKSDSFVDIQSQEKETKTASDEGSKPKEICDNSCESVDESKEKITDESSSQDNWENLIDKLDVESPARLRLEEHSADTSRSPSSYKDNTAKESYGRNQKKDKVKNNKSNFILKDEYGDLFNAPPEYAFAHCVGADFSMSAGIALEFKNRFSGSGNLLDQNVQVGGVAFIEKKDRKIYYLVTKKRSGGKPTYDTLCACLKELRKQMQEHKVDKLAIPEIGSGLDMLDWDKVKENINEVFSETGIEIVVYHYRQAVNSPQDKKMYIASIKHTEKSLVDMEYGTARFYICPVENDFSEEMKILNKKYPILNNLTDRRNLGDIVQHPFKTGDYAYGLVCRQSNKHPIIFEKLEECMNNFNKHNKKDGYEYIGIDAFDEPGNDIIMAQVSNIIKNKSRNIKEIWVCWPDHLKKYCYELNENKRSSGARMSGGPWI